MIKESSIQSEIDKSKHLLVDELAEAARIGDLATIDRLLKSGVDPNVYSKDKEPVSRIATSASGNTPRPGYEWESSALFCAARGGQVKAAERLLQYGIYYESLENFESLLWEALWKKNLEMLKVLLSYRPNRHSISGIDRSKHFYPLLVRAAATANIEIFKLVLDHYMYYEREFKGVYHFVDYDFALREIIHFCTTNVVPSEIYVEMVRLFLLGKHPNEINLGRLIHFQGKIFNCITGTYFTLLTFIIAQGDRDQFQLGKICIMYGTHSFENLTTALDISLLLLSDIDHRNPISDATNKTQLINCILMKLLEVYIETQQTKLKNESKEKKQLRLESSFLSHVSAFFSGISTIELINAAQSLQSYLTAPTPLNLEILNLHNKALNTLPLKNIRMGVEALQTALKKYNIMPRERYDSFVVVPRTRPSFSDENL